MATTNFNLRELQVVDYLDEAIVSDAINKLDLRMGSNLDLVVAADSNITLTDTNDLLSQSGNLTIRVRDPSTILTATRTITFPTRKGMYFVQNLTAQSLNFGVSGGLSVSIATLDSAHIVSDGTDMLLVDLGTSVGGGGLGLDVTFLQIPMTFIGKPAANVELVRIPAIRAYILPTSLTLSKGNAGTAATALSTFSIRKNGVQVGTTQFAAAATAATFTLASDVLYSPGDTFELISPTSQDATLANIGFMFHANKT